MTELPVHYDIYGRRYNFSARNICVRADQGGAEIYEMPLSRDVSALILAHNEKDARDEAYRTGQLWFGRR